MTDVQKTMTKAEREDLMKLIRAREKVLKSTATQRSAVMLAEFEKSIAKTYDFDKDEVWAASMQEVTQQLSAAQLKILEHAKEMGIPEEFAPRLHIQGIWCDRGQNSVKARREELRRVAKAEILALEENARVEIERMSVEAQTEILSHGLITDAAKQFLSALPTVEAFMPTLNIAAVEQKIRRIK